MKNLNLVPGPWPEYELLDSGDNRKLERYGEFIVEGVRAINGALAAGWTIRAFVYPRGRPLSRWA